MPIHDFRCTACGHTKRDQFFKVSEISYPWIQRCPECGKEAFEQIFDEACRAQIHNDKSTMYGMYHPQFGMVLKSYAHKQKLMRRWGLDEASDPVKGNRQHFSEMAYSDGGQPDPNDGGLQWGSWEDVKEKQAQHRTSRLGEEGKAGLK